MLSNLLNINLWKFYCIYGSLLGIEIQDKENKKWVVIDIFFFFGKGKEMMIRVESWKKKMRPRRDKGLFSPNSLFKLKSYCKQYPILIS